MTKPRKLSDLKEIIRIQVKSKINELSDLEEVRYEGGRVYYETQKIVNEIEGYSISDKIIYLQELLDSNFTIQDNLPGQAPDVTDEFKNWIIKTIAKLKIKQLQNQPSFNKQNSINLKDLHLSSELREILEDRITEIEKCIYSKSPLSTIFLIGSTLEGILLDYGKMNLRIFNQSAAAPKDKNKKVISIRKWTLSNLINISKELGLIADDTKRFSHILRDYRNYIHPLEQLKNDFKPSMQTAKLCMETLIVTIEQIKENQNKLNK